MKKWIRFIDTFANDTKKTFYDVIYIQGNKEQAIKVLHNKWEDFSLEREVNIHTDFEIAEFTTFEQATLDYRTHVQLTYDEQKEKYVEDFKKVWYSSVDDYLEKFEGLIIYEDGRTNKDTITEFYDTRDSQLYAYLLQKEKTKCPSCEKPLDRGDVAWNNGCTEYGTGYTTVLIHCQGCEEEIARFQSWYPEAHTFDELLRHVFPHWKE